MKQVRNNMTLFFAKEDEEIARVVAKAYETSGRLIVDLWNVPVPLDCQVHVMTSWPIFVFRSAPWPWKIGLGLSLPVWGSRAAKIWSLAGGWSVSYGRRRAIGVKPPRLLKVAKSKVGKEVFVTESSVEEKVQAIVCHELTHAFTAHLKLPLWLKEGLAMLTVDHFLGRETVRKATLDRLRRSSGTLTPVGARRVDVDDGETLIYMYAFGYWLTRYVAEKDPEAMQGLLSRRRSGKEIEAEFARICELSIGEYRSHIDWHLAAHFA